MFHNSRLMNSRTCGRAWRAAHNISTPIRKPKPTIAKICSHLKQWVEQTEDENVSRRLALRTSSTLISGAVSMYNKELEELLADLQETADAMVQAETHSRQSQQSSDDQGDEPESSGSEGDTPLSAWRLSKDLTFEDSDLEDEELDPEEAEEMEMVPEDHDGGGENCARTTEFVKSVAGWGAKTRLNEP